MLKVVGVADMKTSNVKDDIIVTYALGSCIGLTLYDPVAGAGGLLHAMMPDSKIDPDNSKKNPYMFVDTGIAALLDECVSLGACRERLQVKAAGCSSFKTGNFFKIGYRNFNSLNDILTGYNLALHAYEVGGASSRTMKLAISNGDVLIEDNGKKIKL